METPLGEHGSREFSSSSLVCSECWFLFDSVWAGCTYLGICSFQRYTVGWCAVGSSIYDLVYAFGLGWNASSFILILFIWAFSIFFLVDSSKRFADFIYLRNENNLRNQSPFFVALIFFYCLLYFFSFISAAILISFLLIFVFSSFQFLRVLSSLRETFPPLW